jgi:aminoglycoside/choline kinase family phosphotransferase
MTVKELIEQLSTIEDQNARVMTNGYEGGYHEISQINPEPMDMALNVNTEWYYGAHEKAENVYHEDREKYESVKAIIL